LASASIVRGVYQNQAASSSVGGGQPDARRQWMWPRFADLRYGCRVSTTCRHCGQRKGKRTCPALVGPICSRCCGQHRLVEIDCPSDCVHLGTRERTRDEHGASGALAVPPGLQAFDDDDEGSDGDAPDLGWTYDANRAPDPQLWLATDESLRLAAIEAHHRALAIALPNVALHATIHTVVESQLAAHEPPETTATLERLVSAGVTRHNAIHAIGTVVAHAIWGVLRHTAPVDHEEMLAALARLDPRDSRDGRGLRSKARELAGVVEGVTRRRAEADVGAVGRELTIEGRLQPHRRDRASKSWATAAHHPERAPTRWSAARFILCVRVPWQIYRLALV
jgi:hypothetical protein